MWYALSAVLIFGIVTTASRTALLQLVFVSLCMMLVCRHDGASVLKGLWPVVLALGVWGALWLVSQTDGSEFYGNAKLSQTSTEGLGIRSEMWRQTAALILQHPWAGNGVASYPAVIFLSGAVLGIGVLMSHSHNLLLQLAFSYGIPIALAFTSAVLWVLWRVRHRFMADTGFLAWGCLGCILIHSMFEFPLWYAYFLLPASFFLGWLTCPAAEGGQTLQSDVDGLSAAKRSARIRQRAAISALAGVSVISVAIWMNRDYYKLTPIYMPGLTATLPDRMHEADSVFWFHHFAEFPKLPMETVTPANYQAYLDSLGNVGCLMHEPWIQGGTVLALAYAGRADEAKWIMYLYGQLSGGKVEHFKRALESSNLPLAAELLRYLEKPEPVRPALAFFEQACFGRGSSP
nr:O-antigen ligase family protein [Variovorax terrae]